MSLMEGWALAVGVGGRITGISRAGGDGGTDTQ